ncbi:DUF2157 domain-containing protein [Marinicauda algicola]|nr:DUF2157 domain-containing protein [Marinicauda algicola]
MSYRSRVAKDLDRWIAEGLVEARNRETILQNLSQGRLAWSAAGAAAILGAVLLALAAISFVAANWAGMSRVLRFAVVLAALWAAYGGAALAFARRNEAVGHALALLGAALFGVGIVLTAQTFNMSAFRNTGVLIWTLGALVTALALPSRPVLILAALLGFSWVWLESFNPFAPDIIWSYLPLWLVTALAATRLKSLASWNLISAGLLVWIGFVIWEAGRGDTLSELEEMVLFTLVAGAIALAASFARDREITGSGTLTHWAALASVFTGWALQFPIADFGDAQDRSEIYAWIEIDERWARLFGIEGGAFLIPGAIAAGVILAFAFLRRARGALAGGAAGAIAAAALLALALPYLVRWAGPEMILVLRFALGAAIYAVSVGLILQGAREARRFVGGLGILLFIAQTLHVYGSLFGDLLDTALFFLVGGLLLFALSIGLTRVQKRLAVRSGDEGASA